MESYTDNPRREMENNILTRQYAISAYTLTPFILAVKTTKPDFKFSKFPLRSVIRIMKSFTGKLDLHLQEVWRNEIIPSYTSEVYDNIHSYWCVWLTQWFYGARGLSECWDIFSYRERFRFSKSLQFRNDFELSFSQFPSSHPPPPSRRHHHHHPSSRCQAKVYKNMAKSPELKKRVLLVGKSGYNLSHSPGFSHT